ncbi:hypothetical protein DL770_001256 [Monosporascus sp. CRB-9-2]|nr:hypothetical protein DL770_001256 [Monosporascus sp. CRB-9-2]
MDPSPGNQGGFHEDAELCQYILGGIATTHSLEIRESEISQAGSGLFAMNDIPEGQEIFRSTPLVECVADGVAESVCDWCYTNKFSRVHPSGRFRTKEDAAPDMEACRGCGKCYYCSKSCQGDAWEAYHGHECSELRVRSLRPIKAGEELLQCYTDVTCDVLMRRKRLKDQFFFDCTCPRCEREYESHKRRTFNDMSEVEFVRETQEELTELINSAIIKMKTSPDGFPLVELEARGRSLVNDAFPRSRWPDTLDPVPLLYKRLGNMHLLRGSGVAAFQCSIKGCAYTDWKLGPEWVNDLHDLIRIMTAIVVQPSAREVFRDKHFLSSREFWDVYHGFLHTLLLTSQHTFGSDASYTRAIKTWYDDTLEGAEEPLPGTPGFEDRFKAAHRKLLSWAGVSEKYWRLDTV